MMMLMKLAASLAALYLIVIALIALAQDRLLFPRWAMGNGTDLLPASAERLTLEVASGDVLVGVHLPAEARPPAEAALILGFGGNAWNAETLATYLHSVFPDRAVVAFHYRGYAPSTGRPSASAILQDALSIYDELIATLAPERMVAVGLSIGAGPAAHLASQRSITGLILVTPFDSLEALAREHYPWAPVGLLLRHRMEIADALAVSSAPVALIAAESDDIVPARRTDPLRRSAGNLVLDRVILDAGHNDLYDRAEFKRAMREALSLIETGGGSVALEHDK
jgi:pimeloyl-ACP methyl ester carboxylesterase